MADSLIYEIADALDPDLRVAFLAMVNAAVRIVPLSMIENAIQTGNRTFLAELVSTLSSQGMIANSEKMMQILTSAVKAGAMAGGVSMGGMFELKSPRVAAWITEHAGGFIAGLVGESMTGIKTVILAGNLEGLTVPSQARAIRSLIGLNSRDAQAVGRYATGLSGVIPEPRLSQLVELYSHRLLSSRAEMIARTETARATLGGQYELWRQLFDERTLQTERTWVQWVTAEDDKVCPYCAPMDGKKVRFDQDFIADEKGFPNGPPENPPKRKVLKPDPWGQQRDKLGRFVGVAKAATGVSELVKIPRLTWPDGRLPHPPLHPRCRCDVILVFDK